MAIREMYTPVPIAANGTARLDPSIIQVAGFLCQTSGTITIVNARGITLLNAFPVTAGVYLPIPMSLRTGGNNTSATNAVITLAGGASGTLLY